MPLLNMKMYKLFVAAALVLATTGLQAQADQAVEPAGDTVLMEGAGQKLTLTDLRGALLRMPPEQRQQVLASKGQLVQLVTDLFSRRVLAANARSRGLDKGAEASALRRIAEDAALSDLAVLAIDAEVMPDDKQLAERARAIYTKNPKEYDRSAGTHASHILFRHGDDKAAARKDAEEVLAKLNAGGDFAALATEYSDDPGSAARGGDLGFFPVDRVVKPFGEAVAKLKPGETSGLVETEYGYHIIRLHARRQVGPAPFEEVRPMLEARVRGELMEQARARELERLLKGSLIQSDALDLVIKANLPTAPAGAPAAAAAAPAPAAKASATK